MEFKVGRLYKSKTADIIIQCTANSEYLFAGVVVDNRDSELYENGETSTSWVKDSFEEYHESKETVATLQNGHKYNIPKGCKATITGDVIEIEEDLRYFYHKKNGCTGYYKDMTDTTIQVAFYDDGDISIISTSNIFDWSDHSTKEEFETAYNKAMEVLKL